jgi:hypothetical protein|tara:strand:+ start:1625 stop:1813 length:189 start_codon:yes stop_codon:yes gene_type:complete
MDKFLVFEKLRNLSKEYDVVILTAQQPPRKFSGYQRELRLSPHTGEGKYIGFFPIDHVDLIK